MTDRRGIEFVAVTLLTAALTHAVSAIAVTWAIDRVYTDRMFDVRQWPGPPSEGFRLAGSYLRERLARSRPPVTLFAGSSVTHGYPWSQSQTFAHLYSAAAGTTTINASILALDVSGVNDWILCAARRNGLRVAVLIVEVPVVNTVSQLASYHRASSPAPPLSDCRNQRADPGYARLAWSHPLGVGWFVFLWEREAFVKPDTVMTPAPVPAGYFTSAADFAAVAGDYDAQIVAMVANARTVADRVFVFASPVFTGGLASIGEDDEAVAGQLTRTVDACRRAGGAVCLDASFLGARQDYFMNFTHLNQAGHRVMAEWLAGQAR